MEEDYFDVTPKKEQLLDELGIEYHWRDSCVNLLVDVKRCMKNDYKSTIPIINRLSFCKPIQDKWKKCEKDRELKLLDTYVTKYKTYQENLAIKGGKE